MYRLTVNPALELGDNTISRTFASLEELQAAEEFMSVMLIFLQDDINAMPDYSNYFLAEGWVDNDWSLIEEY